MPHSPNDPRHNCCSCPICRTIGLLKCTCGHNGADHHTFPDTEDQLGRCDLCYCEIFVPAGDDDDTERPCRLSTKSNRN